MAINLNKVKVNLTANQTANLPSVAGSLIASLKEFTDSAPKTAEGEIAFTDEDTSARYIRLQRKGLNILRTEIIAITEYIPVAVGNDLDENVNKIQYQLGDNKQVSITNVARLIELHRQIREYVMSATEAVLKKMYPDIYKPRFLKKLKKVINDNFENLVEPDIETTILNIATVVKESESGRFARIIKRNANNPFLIATMEYFIYENLINTIISYLGQVAQIDEVASKNWSIDNFNKLKSYSPENVFKGIIKNLYTSSYTTRLGNANFVAKNVLDMHKNSSNSNIDIFTNAQSHLVSLISLKDSASVLSTSSRTDKSNLEIDSGNVRYGINGDLARSINKLKSIEFKDMAAGLPSGTGEDKKAIGIRNFNSDLNMSTLKKVFSSIETASGEKTGDISEGINELLAALSYDFITFAVCKNNVADQLSSLKGSITGNHKDILNQYLEASLGASPSDQHTRSGAVLATRNEIPNKGNVNNKRYFGNFSLPLAGLRQDNMPNQFGQVDSDVFYTPLESTRKEVGENGQGYIPAPQYFIENAIERAGADDNGNVNIDFKELDSFTDEYRAAADNLHLDIMTLIPDTNNNLEHIGRKSAGTKGAFLGNDNNTLSYLKNLNEELAQDIHDIIMEGRDTETSILPILAVFISDVPDSQKIKNFMSIFWCLIERYSSRLGFADNGRKLVTDALRDKGNVHDDFVETIASMVEYYNESAVHGFLNDTCNFDLRSGGVGKKKLHKSRKKFTVVMAEAGNVVHSNGKHTKDKIPSDKALNSDALGIPRTNSTVFNIEPGQIDNVFDNCFGNGNRHQKIRKTVRNGAQPFGFHRILHRSLVAVAFGKDSKIESALGKDLAWGSNLSNIADRNDEDDKTTLMFDLDSNNDVKLTTGLGTLGSICQLKLHHRCLIWIYYVYNLLRKTIQIHIKAGSSGNLELKIDYDQLRGLRDALRGNARPATAGSKRHSYDEASAIINDLYLKVDIRQAKIKDTSALFTLHADALKEVKRTAKSVIAGNSTQDNKSSLAISTMIKLKIYSDALTLNNDESPALITQSFQKNYMTTTDSLLPRDIYFSANKSKFMLKYMSTPGYGFLKNEKRGNKSVLHVGIPNSMISALRLNAFEETDDIRYLDSPYVCISVFKKSHLYPDYNFHPKNYIFDTSANILDYNPKNGKDAHHLLNFKDDSTFDELLRSIEVSRFKVDENGNMNSRVSKGYGQSAYHGLYRKDVLINHATDYVLKEYNKLTTGLDFDESSFLLIDEPLDFNKINPTLLLGDKLSGEYLKILEKIGNLYPETETDQQLKSEVFRLTKLIKQSAPFSFVNRFKKTVIPKSFDKVYSIIVNEKDFILNTAEDIFTQPVEFHINSKIQRPEKLKNSFGDKLFLKSSSTNVARPTSQQSKYAKSIAENYPEVYNYSVALSLLPTEFEPGAVLKPPFKESQSQTITMEPAPDIGGALNFKIT